jgi:quercetin dioxygenase-like cupin family protein
VFSFLGPQYPYSVHTSPELRTMMAKALVVFAALFGLLPSTSLASAVSDSPERSSRGRRVKKGMGMAHLNPPPQTEEEEEEDAPAEFDLSAVMGTTMVNGYVPPGELLPLFNTTVMIDVENADGLRLHVVQGYRKAMTRVGIHVHKYGGHTCVLSGVITDFVEGKDPHLYPAGSCYYMPPNVPMTATNLGSVDALLIDTFILPFGEDFITIIEPGYPGYAGDV